MQKALLSIAALVVVAGTVFVFMQAKPVVEGPVATENSTTGTTTNGSMAKIDINAVCEGALAYMTFPDGDAAAEFVAECKAGEHPEVIERYKADMGYTDDAAI